MQHMTLWYAFYSHEAQNHCSQNIPVNCTVNYNWYEFDNFTSDLIEEVFILCEKSNPLPLILI